MSMSPGQLYAPGRYPRQHRSHHYKDTRRLLGGLPGAAYGGGGRKGRHPGSTIRYISTGHRVARA
eukprot:2000667-Rhodomonas_salina.1